METQDQIDFKDKLIEEIIESIAEYYPEVKEITTDKNNTCYYDLYLILTYHLKNK